MFGIKSDVFFSCIAAMLAFTATNLFLGALFFRSSNGFSEELATHAVGAGKAVRNGYDAMRNAYNVAMELKDFLTSNDASETIGTLRRAFDTNDTGEMIRALQEIAEKYPNAKGILQKIIVDHPEAIQLILGCVLGKVSNAPAAPGVD
ncbi:MAG: hypothetical protein LBR79_01530 [Oscillospiraceae bacterium]|jgi:hypothetical protein|nr:hypothetical protein [Oscillospiraceae bacterium]